MIFDKVSTHKAHANDGTIDEMVRVVSIIVSHNSKHSTRENVHKMSSNHKLITRQSGRCVITRLTSRVSGVSLHNICFTVDRVKSEGHS
jgi:hypothetical protein